MRLNAARIGCVLAVGLSACHDDRARRQVGPQSTGGDVLPTGQLVRPAGDVLTLSSRPVDLALGPDEGALYVKDNRGVLVVDPRAWVVRQSLPFEKAGGSLCGIAVTADGRRVYATTAGSTLAEATVQPNGELQWTRQIALAIPSGSGASFPCGLALTRDAKTALVCLSRGNALAEVDLETGSLVAAIRVGVAPFAVQLSTDQRWAYVSNWGGRRAAPGDATASSAGTDAVIDERGVAASGTVSVVDVAARQEVAQVPVGLAPGALALSRDGRTLYVASANADTVAFIDVARHVVTETLAVQPAQGLPIGSMPNGLALGPDGRTLYISTAGHNAVGVVRLTDDGARSRELAGFIPAGWYPGALLATRAHLYVANIKGTGSRTRRPDQPGWNSHGHSGTLSRIAIPGAAQLRRYTAQVREDAGVPAMLRSLERGSGGARPVPVPEHPGAPSVFEHVVYVIKENRTYDQVFGDIPAGNGDPALCIYGQGITPNHHALAEEFVLLDNFYCNGVLSADGHSWCTEGNVTPYLERAFGGFARSYTFGDDPLTYSASGFIWDHVLAVPGNSFRNYGEFDYAGTKPDSDYTAVYQDFMTQAGRIQRTQNIGVERLRRYSCPEYPGWNMNIPDVLRAAVFLKELAAFEQQGCFPSLTIVYLPNDHTSGTAAGQPTPRALMADNDLALGQIVEGLSHSRFWPKLCIFVIEDDPQDGFDHVDGHRSLCLVVSPYTRRGAVVREFYNQTAVLHTMERILGVEAQHQLYALAPVMSTCFTTRPDYAPYTCRPNLVPLAELNPAAAALSAAEREWALRSAALPLEHPDGADEDTLNRILWHAARGTDVPYPAEWAGAHGRGLAALHLQLEGAVRPAD